MKSFIEFISESKTSASLSLKWEEALMLRDFLRQAIADDMYNFGTKEDKENIQAAFEKLDKMVENW